MISSNSKNAKGVTLVELMVVIAVLGIVLGLVYSIFISQMRSSIWRGQLADAKQGIDGAIQVMISDYIKADYVVNTTGVCNTTVAVSVDGSTIRYYKDGTDLIRDHSTDGTAVVAENVTDLKFLCYDKNGALEPPPPGGGAYSSGEEKEIRRVKITATGETSRESPVTGDKAKITVTTSIEFRNIPQYAGAGCGVLYLDIADSTVAFCDPPGNTTTLDIWLCNLIGNAMGGDVEIAPKGGLPLTITGSGVAEVGGKTIMTIPTPAASALCGDPGTKGTATIAALDPEDPNLAPGANVEVVASWQPTGCGYYISTAKSLAVVAGEPYRFENNALGLTHAGLPLGVMNACQSDVKADLHVKVVDSCGNKMPGKVVQFLVYDGNPPPPAGTGSGSPVTGQPDYGGVTATVDNGDGTYSAIYNAGNLAGTVYLVAKSDDIVNATNSQITNAITLVPHVPDHLELTSSSPVGGVTGLDECPNISSTISFQVQDYCNNPREDEASNFDPESGAETTRGSISQVYGSGITYSSIYNTPSDCGPGAEEGFYNAYFDHDGIGGNPDLTVPLLLNKCPVPGVSLSLARPEPIPDNELYAGCLDEELQVTATVYKTGSLGTCEPDPSPANILFEVKNLKGGGGEIPYADTDPRNARFLTELTGSPDLASHEKTGTEGTAIADLVAYGARPGDTLYVHAIANIGAWGWAEYTSTDYQITVVNSPATGNFYTDPDYSIEADKYTVPDLVPTLGTGTLYAEIRDCDENLDPVATMDSIEATLSSDNKTGIINTLTVTMLETGLNTGVFRAAVPMKREAAAGTLMVDKGGFITGEYADDDEHPDISGTVPLTGCRDFRVVDADDNDIGSLRPDVEEGGVYTTDFPDDYGFYLIMNVPTFAGNGIQNTVTVHTCSSVEEDTVTMVEEEADNGILRISNLNPLGNYVFVGEGPDEPLPGGDDSAGIRVAESPDSITIVYPENPTPTVCDTLETSLQNWGCYASFEATDVDAPLVTYTPPADPVQGMIYFTNYLITADDGPGTIQTVNLKFCNTEDCSDTAYTPYSASPGTSTFSSTSDGSLADFDSTEMQNGTYYTFAEAFDTESNRGVSRVFDRTIDNTCRIDDTGTPLTITRNPDDTINVSGKFLLNNVGDEATALFITVTDGDDVSYGPFSTTTASNGDFSWNSSVAYVAPVRVTVDGERNLCIAPTATNEETCEVVIDEATTTYDILTGAVTVNWEYLLGGVPHSAELNATAESAQPASDSAPTITASSNSWISGGVFTDNTVPITVTATGQFGACSAEDTLALTPPVCSISTTTSYDVMTGYTTVDWQFLMDDYDGSGFELQAADSISGSADSATGEGPDTYASTGASGIWNSGDGTPTVFTSNVTGTLDGSYGYCVAPTHEFTIPIPACSLTTTQSYDILTGYTTVGWEFLRGGTPQAVSSISGTASSASEGPAVYSTSGVSSGIWNSAPTVFTSDVTGTLDANYGVCVAPTESININVPTCSLDVQSSSYNVGDGTVSAKWSLLMDSGSGPVAQDATSLSGTATGVVAPSETESTSGSGAFVDWTTTQVYTSDVNVTLDGNYGACAAPTENFTLTRPTCSLNITGQSYDILTGYTTVGWEFYMDSGTGPVSQAADNISGTATSGLPGETDTYSASGASGIWNSGDPTTTVFTGSVTGTLDGYYGVCVAPTQPISITVPTCSVTVTNELYNPDGTISVDWQYKLDGVGHDATGSGTAATGAPWFETASSGALTSDGSGNFTWSPAQTFSDDVTGTVTANYGVCVDSQPISLARPTCPGDIEFYDSPYVTPVTYYDVPIVAPAVVNSTAYVQVSDCDENENRSLVDTINVTLISNTPAIDPWDKTVATLVETGINTGVFQNAVTMTRWDWLPETLEVESGSIVRGIYVDDDDLTDTDVDALGLTGCRGFWVTDSSSLPIGGVGVDTSPYDPSYPDGPTAFHIALSMPAFTGNGSSDTTTVRVCSYDPILVAVEDTRVVTMAELGDTGLMGIDGSSYGGYDYIYVGEDASVAPEPGGYADVGIRVPAEPTQIRVGYPAGPDCDFLANPDFENYGMCEPMWGYWPLLAQTCVRDISLGGSHTTGILGGDCYTSYRGTGTDYNAEKYNFTLTDNTYVKIEMTSPAGPTQFDTYLHLINATSSTMIEKNDDFDPLVSTDSAIVRWLPPGDYTIEATSYYSSTYGEFDLSLTDQEALCPLAPIALGDTVSGTTSANCGLTQDPAPPPPDPSGEWYTRHYELTLASPMNVRFDISGSGASPMILPHVFVYDSNLNLIDYNMSSLVLPLPAGTYIIEVMDQASQNTELGYTLSVYGYAFLTAIDSGWYTSAGAHTPTNENYIVGDLTGTEYRDFFVFNIPGASGTIYEATLYITNPVGGYLSSQPTETWTAFDVSTSIADLVGGIGGVAAFDDLGTGTSYGSVVVDATTTMAVVPLTAGGVSAVDAAKGGQIAIGGALTTLDASPNTERVFGTSGPSSAVGLMIKLK